MTKAQQLKVFEFACARIMGRLSKRASIAQNARSSKKAKEDAEDKVNHFDGVDKDDENEEGIDDEESSEREESIDFTMEKFKGHRIIDASSLQKIKAEFEKK